MPANSETSQLAPHSPSALIPIYPMPEPNTAIALYRGRVEMGAGASAVPFDGVVELTWLPRYGIGFQIPAGAMAAQGFGQKSVVSIAKYGMTATGHILNSHFGFNAEGEYGSTSGLLTGFDIAPLVGLSEVMFHLPNFTDYHGLRLRNSKGGLSWGRLCLIADGWRVLLDEVVGAIEKVKASGGYVFTHVGQIERADGSLFSSEEVTRVREVLTYLFWFAKGRYSSPMLLVGFSAAGQRIWEDWSPARQQRWENSLSWFPENSSQALAEIFPAMLQMANEQTWYEPLKLAISWYLQASDAPTMEGGVVLAQVGLELLAWVEVVEKRQIISKDGFDKLTTTDKMRLFFSLAHIPLSFPAELAALGTLAANTQNGKKPWTDGPEALVEFRNSVTHARRRDTAYGSPADARWDALKLGLWYLELSILHVLGYQGFYTCRLRDNLIRGQQERVPWAAV